MLSIPNLYVQACTYNVRTLYVHLPAGMIVSYKSYILNALFLIPEIKCPAGMTYKSSTNACPNTCENQYAEDECHLSDRERCACPDGEFQRNGSCVATCGVYQQLQQQQQHQQK